MKEDCLLEGKILRGEAERPLGETNALEIGEVKLDFVRWLAMGEEAAMPSYICFSVRETMLATMERERERESQYKVFERLSAVHA